MFDAFLRNVADVTAAPAAGSQGGVTWAAMRILHVLDHSLPLHSGYTFRTAAILREQRALGWETLQLTTPRHGNAAGEVEDVDGWRFHRTPARRNLVSACPARCTCRRWRRPRAASTSSARTFRPDVLHAHSPVLNALPTLRVGRQLGIPVVYEVRALWEDAAVDHGTNARRQPALPRVARRWRRFALRRADHVTTICEGLRDEIVARGIAARPDHRDPQCGRHRRLPVRRRARRRAAHGDSASTARRCSASPARSTPTRASTC